jgi:hypothetical protein
MILPPRAAAVRGDDYQYAVGWVAACEALVTPGSPSSPSPPPRWGGIRW